MINDETLNVLFDLVEDTRSGFTDPSVSQEVTPLSGSDESTKPEDSSPIVRATSPY